MTMLRAIFATLFLSLLYPFYSFGQSQNWTHIAHLFSDTQMAIDSSASYVKSNYPVDSTKRNSFLKQVPFGKKLIDAYSFKLSKMLNDQDSDTLTMRRYVNETKNMAVLMKNASKSKSIDKIDSIFTFICTDITNKLAISTTPESPIGSGARDCPPLCGGTDTRRITVEVTIRVMRLNSRAQIPGYNAFAKPEFSLDESLTDTFNPTDNAILDIVPGKKKIWIMLGNRIIDQRTVLLSLARPKVNVDFYIH